MENRERDRNEDDRHLDDGYYFDMLKMQHAQQESTKLTEQNGNQEKHTDKN